MNMLIGQSVVSKVSACIPDPLRSRRFANASATECWSLTFLDRGRAIVVCVAQVEDGEPCRVVYSHTECHEAARVLEESLRTAPDWFEIGCAP